jgi:putative DNA methylase
MTDAPWKKKLIEVALPLDAINVASAREKSIRHGHPSTLHLWWARRPLAACRAVLFAQLVDDPSAHPEEFPTEEDQDRERKRLFGIIEELVKWENSTNERVLDAARAEIQRSCGGNPPPILDPFAGGGSIPLEAQRLGLEAHASDLNPVAVLINKALIEIPPRWADHPPVHPDADNRTRWKGAEGLAEDVRRYGKWMRDEAEKRVGRLYPRATLPDGTETDVIAWIWSRTVECPNPACGATVPLTTTLWLRKRKGAEVWLLSPDPRRPDLFEIGRGGVGPRTPPKIGRGATFECYGCGAIADDTYIKQEGMNGRMGVIPLARSIRTEHGRDYIAGSRDEEYIVPAVELDLPLLSTHPQYMGTPRYGLKNLRDLFTPRQLALLHTIVSAVPTCRETVSADAQSSGTPLEAAERYATDVCTYLALAASKMSAFHTTLARWRSDADKSAPAFGRQAIAMVWDFAEVNPFSGGGGDWTGVVGGVAALLENLRPGASGLVVQNDARKVSFDQLVLTTDPPYYDSVPYADLSDFFYPWLKLALGEAYPGLFATLAAPKSGELVADSQRYGSRSAADNYFESGFLEVLSKARRSANGSVPATIFYAFKQTEGADGHGQGSTGWATMLEGLQQAGWTVTATWPIRTEGATRMRGQGSNALASSVVLACRPRPSEAGVTDRQGLIRALREELPMPLRELQKAHIAPVDLRQAAIGPGMAVFSRFARVIEPDGSSMRVRTALGLINHMLGKVLDEQEEEFDSETRWAIQWFSQFYADEGPYGVAEQLAVSMNVAVRNMVDSGILTSGGGKARLRGRDELPDHWDPTKDLRTSVWEATQHLVKRLETDGEASAGRLLRQLGGLGDSAQLLAYRLYTVCEKARPALAGRYNALVASWPEIQRHAREASQPATTIEQQTFGA